MRLGDLPGDWSLVQGSVDRRTYEAHIDDEDAERVVEGTIFKLRSVTNPVMVGGGGARSAAPAIAVTARYVLVEKYPLLQGLWRIRLALTPERRAS